MSSVDSSGLCVCVCVFTWRWEHPCRAGHPAGPVGTSEQTGNERTDAWGTAGCLMHLLQRFFPAGKPLEGLESKCSKKKKKKKDGVWL